MKKALLLVWDFVEMAVVFVALLMIIEVLFGCQTRSEPWGTKLVQRMCPDTQILVATPEAWSKDDQQNLDIAKQRCGEKYPQSPCVVKFIRYEQLRYSAICGHNQQAETENGY